MASATLSSEKHEQMSTSFLNTHLTELIFLSHSKTSKCIQRVDVTDTIANNL